MQVELGARRDGTMTALRIRTVAITVIRTRSANPSKFPAGLFSICTGSYDIKQAFCEVDAAYPNKTAGRCGLSLFVPRHRGGARHRTRHRCACEQAGHRRSRPAHAEFIKPEQFPYKSALGWEYDSGNYHAALKRRWISGYEALRAEQGRETQARRTDGHRDFPASRNRRCGPSRDFRHPGA